MKDEKLEYIYRQYRKLVLETAYSVLKDYHLAQDVCQDVFIKLSPDRIVLIEKPNQIKGYLLALAYHRAIDYYRTINGRSEVNLATGINLPTITDMDNKIDFEIFTNVLFKDLKEKNEEWYQIVIRLGFYDEPAEIVARDLGISINLLRSKYHRARKWIRRNYECDYNFLKDC